MVTWGPGNATPILHSQVFTATNNYFPPSIAYKYKTSKSYQNTLHKDIILHKQLKYATQEKSQILPLYHLPTKQTNSVNLQSNSVQLLFPLTKKMSGLLKNINKLTTRIFHPITSHTLKQRHDSLYNSSSIFPVLHFKYFSPQTKLVPTISNEIILNRKTSPSPKPFSTNTIESHPLWHFSKNANDLKITQQNYLKNKSFNMLTSHSSLKFLRPSIPEIPIELTESKSLHEHSTKPQMTTLLMKTFMMKKTFQTQFNFHKTPSTFKPKTNGKQTNQMPIISITEMQQRKLFSPLKYGTQKNTMPTKHQKLNEASHYLRNYESTPQKLMISAVLLAKQAKSQNPSTFIKSTLNEEIESDTGIKQYINPQFKFLASSTKSLHHAPEILVKYPKTIFKKKENRNETQSKLFSSIFNQTIKSEPHKKQYELPTSLSFQKTVSQLQKSYTENLKAITPNNYLEQKYLKNNQQNSEKILSQGLSTISKMTNPFISIPIINKNQQPEKNGMQYTISKTPSIYEPSFPVLYVSVKHLPMKNQFLHELLHKLNTYTEPYKNSEQTSINTNKNFTNEIKVNSPEIKTKTQIENQVVLNELGSKFNKVSPAIFFPFSKPIESNFHKQNKKVQAFINTNYKSIPTLKTISPYNQTANSISLNPLLTTKRNTQATVNVNHQILPFLNKKILYVNKQIFSQHIQSTNNVNFQSLASVSASQVFLPQVNTANSILPITKTLSYQTSITPKYNIFSVEISKKLNSKMSSTISSNQNILLPLYSRNFMSEITKYNNLEISPEEICTKTVQIQTSPVTLPGFVSNTLSPPVQTPMNHLFQMLSPFKKYITKPVVKISTVASQENSPILELKSQNTIPKTLMNILILSTKTVSPFKSAIFSTNHQTMPSLISQSKIFTIQAPNKNTIILPISTPKFQELISKLSFMTEKGNTDHLKTNLVKIVTPNVNHTILSSQGNNILTPVNADILNSIMPSTCTFCSKILSMLTTKRLPITKKRTVPAFTTNIKKSTGSSQSKILTETGQEFSPELTKENTPITSTVYKILFSQEPNHKRSTKITLSSTKDSLDYVLNRMNQKNQKPTTMKKFTIVELPVINTNYEFNNSPTLYIKTSTNFEPVKVSLSLKPSKNINLFPVTILNKTQGTNMQKSVERMLANNQTVFPLAPTRQEFKSETDLSKITTVRSTKSNKDFSSFLNNVPVYSPIKNKEIKTPNTDYSKRFSMNTLKPTMVVQERFQIPLETKIPSIKSSIESRMKGSYPSVKILTKPNQERFEFSFKTKTLNIKPSLELNSKGLNLLTQPTGQEFKIFNLKTPRIKLPVESQTKMLYLPIKPKETFDKENFESSYKTKLPIIKYSEVSLDKMSYAYMTFPINNKETFRKEDFEFFFKTKPPNIKPLNELNNESSPKSHWIRPSQENFEIPLKTKTANIKPVIEMSHTPIQNKSSLDEENIEITFKTKPTKIKPTVEPLTKQFNLLAKIPVKPIQERSETPFETKIPTINSPAMFYTKFIYLSSRNTQKPRKVFKAKKSDAVIFASNKPNFGPRISSYETSLTQKNVISPLKHSTQEFYQRLQTKFMSNPKQGQLSEEKIHGITPKVLVQALIPTKFLTSIGSKFISPTVTGVLEIIKKISTKSRKQIFSTVSIPLILSTTVANHSKFPSINLSRQETTNMATPKKSPFLLVSKLKSIISKFSFSHHNSLFTTATGILGVKGEKTPHSYGKKNVPQENTLYLGSTLKTGQSHPIKDIQTSNLVKKYQSSQKPKILKKYLDNKINSKTLYKGTYQKDSTKLNKQGKVLEVTEITQSFSFSKTKKSQNIYETGKLIFNFSQCLFY